MIKFRKRRNAVRPTTRPLFARSLFGRNRMESELDEELQFHISMKTDEHIRQGLDGEAARRASIRDFGGMDLAKEACRDERGFRWLEALRQELHYAVRTLLKEKTFTAVSVLTFAVGIAALTSMYSVFDSALIQPLSYEGNERLVAVVAREGAVPCPYAVSFQYYRFLRDQNRDFTGIGLYAENELEYATVESREPVKTACVTATVFQMLKTEPIRGRVFSLEEDRVDGPGVAVVSSSFWRNRVAAREDILGQQIILKGRPRIVIGVLPSSFSFPSKAVEIWVPLQSELAQMLNNPRAAYPRLVATVKSTVHLTRAEQNLRSMIGRLDKEYKGWTPRSSEPPCLVYYRDYVLGDSRMAMVILLIASLFVMAIACANVTNLFLVRAEKKRRESAVRIVLGAGKPRLLLQNVSEALLVSVAGCALGIVFAWWSLDWLKVLAREMIPRLNEARMGMEGLGVAVAGSFLASLVIGTIPVFKFRERSMLGALGTSQNVSGQAGRHLRGILVMTEFALAIVLMVGAGLMIRSLQAMLSIGLGFNPEQAITFYPKLPRSHYSTSARSLDFCERLESRLRALPGVLAVGITNRLPLYEGLIARSFIRADKVSQLVQTLSYSVSPGYFAAMGIPILEGRGFMESDRGKSFEQVVIIDESLAKRFWPNDRALGKTLFVPPVLSGKPGEMVRLGDERQNISLTIVGIVPSVRKYGFKSAALKQETGEETGEYYRSAGSFNGSDPLWANFFVLRLKGDMAGIRDAIGREISSLDKAVTISELNTMKNRWLDSSADTRYYTAVLNIFGMNALILAAIGIYGIIAFTIAQRTHEFGVRMVLGANRRQILRLAAAEGVYWVLIGTSVGLIGGMALSRLLRSMLFQVQNMDILTYVGVLLIIAAVACVACYVPARRATLLDPWTVLRIE